MNFAGLCSFCGFCGLHILINVDHAECVLYVFDVYVRRVLGADDGYDVIANHAVLLPEHPSVCPGRHDDVTALVGINGLRWASVVCRGASLHLNEDEGGVITVYAYKVDVSMAVAPVTVPYIPSLILHVLCGDILAPTA